MARVSVAMTGLEREYAALGPSFVPLVTEVLASARFILGPQVRAFEEEVSRYLGGVHAVGCASGTDALVLALRALEIAPGDEVVVPAFTFAATAEAVAAIGAVPVFADIDPETFTIDPGSATAAVGPRTRAVLPVHLFGHCAPMEPLWELAERRGLAIVEDAAQAMGARWRGRPAGALGSLAAFSFFPTKNLGAPGDGGMVTTADAQLAERLRRLRAHGSARRDVHEAIGTNSRLDELHAAILRAKLPRLDAWNARRREIAARYRAALRPPAVVAPCELAPAHHVYHQFTVRARARDELVARLEAAGIGSAVYYPTPLHQQPAYVRWARGPLPEAERAAREALSLPVHPWLTDDEVERVAAVLAAVS
jgi:dTDP-4-amino-4,6-dideoxygalactose transaminase